MQLLNPRDLRDARINDVFVESPSRLLLHLKDGRAVAIAVDPVTHDNLVYEVVNTA